MRSKLIVFEGADGIGKTTQAKFLFEYLRKQKIPTKFISFPRYNDNLWGQMIRRYLDGEFGDVDSVNPYLAAVLYAGDRLLAKEKIKKWLNGGKVVVCDRYAPSNIAHQVVKIKNQKSKIKFIRWISQLEYEQNNIPMEDAVILLTLPISIAQKFMKKRKRDIHEVDLNYQKKVAQAFEDLAKKNKNWIKVSNVTGGKLRSIEDVQMGILEVLKQRHLLFERT